MMKVKKWQLPLNAPLKVRGWVPGYLSNCVS
jgi:hypothetical protein